jgi:phage gp46-like protein
MMQLTYDMDTQTSDLSRPDDANFESSELLNTAVFMSLFTRRRAEDDDVLPEPLAHREGWWGSAYEKESGHQIGSRLWLLRRAAPTQSTLNYVKTYSYEALQWMLDDGIAKSIDVEVEWQEGRRLAFKVEITKPDKVASRWTGVWDAHLGEL